MKRRKEDEGQFVRDPETCGGEAVFRGTRVLLRVVLADLADGASAQDILRDFPALTEEHVRAAIAFAAAADRDGMRDKVEAGLRDLEAGRAIPHEDVIREGAELVSSRARALTEPELARGLPARGPLGEEIDRS